MSKIQRMQTVSGVLAERLDEAARKLARSRARLAQERTRLQQLEGFRDDYSLQHGNTTGTTVRAFQLQDFNAFLTRLDAAIRQQQQHIGKVEQELAASQRHWQAERSRFEAVNKLVQTYRDAERSREEEAEQQQLDDHAVQRYLFNRDR